MHTNTMTYDTNGELLVQPYKNGIQLVKPTRQAQLSGTRVDELYAMSISCFFLSSDSVILDGNDKIAATVGANSVNDMSGHDSGYFCERDFSARMIANDQAVMRSASMKVVEETGERVDDFLINAMSMKFPWYYEEKIIGVLGCSLHIDAAEIKDFARTFIQFSKTGLLGPISKFPVNALDGNLEMVYFSKRELEVMKLLVQNKTAREIGESLAISKRTVEHHIENMKLKANCLSKFELIYKYSNKFI